MPRMPWSVSRSLATLLVALLASGCGIKGPLYLATPEQKARAEERKQRREAAALRDATPPAAGGQSQGEPAARGASATDPWTSPSAASEIVTPDESFGPSAPPQ